MEMRGEYRIAAPREKVWRALNDPEILRRSIPGCREIEKITDNHFTAKVIAKVGPVKAVFVGSVTLSNLHPLDRYTISGEAKGGPAGFARGEAQVTLTPDGDSTLLSYTVNATVGGKLAQIGSRLIDAAARKMAAQFFGAFVEAVDGTAPSETPPVSQIAPIIWVTTLIVSVVLVMLYFSTAD